MVQDPIDPPKEHDELPTRGSGFDEPSAAVKRRNLITAALIMALVVAMVSLSMCMRPGSWY
ncbi:MAG: hypothetical protein H0U74_07805 [Bradymonadaceae bacterium]|nr:hypothetical protein [Lujinxingiaceae bacterium]